MLHRRPCRERLKLKRRPYYSYRTQILLKKTLEKYGDKAPGVVRVLKEGFDYATAVLALPERCCRCLRTTNLHKIWGLIQGALVFSNPDKNFGSR